MIKDPVHQSKSQTAAAYVHQLCERTNATAGIALAHENVMTEGENGAGLEIVAIGTERTGIKMDVGPRIARGASVGSAITIDEVGEFSTDGSYLFVSY
jgi:hypothetical protein